MKTKRGHPNFFNLFPSFLVHTYRKYIKLCTQITDIMSVISNIVPKNLPFKIKVGIVVQINCVFAVILQCYDPWRTMQQSDLFSVVKSVIQIHKYPMTQVILLKLWQNKSKAGIVFFTKKFISSITKFHWMQYHFIMYFALKKMNNQML